MNELMRGLYLCFALAVFLNLVFVLVTPATPDGHAGYFPWKNYLGELAAVGLFFALYEVTNAGSSRVLAGLTIVISIFLLTVSHNKTSLGLAVVVPIVAAFVIVLTASAHISAVAVLSYLAAAVTLSYIVASDIFGFSTDDATVVLFGDPSFTGRTTIWAFAMEMIQRRPVLGWGYQSFWLVGPDAPSVLQAPDWVAEMAHAHNGYLDTMLETGLIGFAVLILFILTTLHALGRVAEREPRRAWLGMTLALFIILTNFIETTFLHSYDVLWLLFLVLAAEPAQRPASTVTKFPAFGTTPGKL
jgi:O-antigen ligase